MRWSAGVEHILSIIGSLFFYLEANDIQRVLNKFAENDYEKVDRLVELYVKYSRKMQVRPVGWRWLLFSSADMMLTY